MSSWTGDAAAAAAADGTATGTPGQQQQQQQQQQRQQQRQELPIQPSPPAALQAFWCEQGLTAAQAQQLLKEVADDPQLAAAAALSNTQVRHAPRERAVTVRTCCWCERQRAAGAVAGRTSKGSGRAVHQPVSVWPTLLAGAV
jgi:hypothetical protein